MQSKVWEAKVGVPKLLGIQLPLGNYTEEAGVRLGWGESTGPQGGLDQKLLNSRTSRHLWVTWSWE